MSNKNGEHENKFSNTRLVNWTKTHKPATIIIAIVLAIAIGLIIALACGAFTETNAPTNNNVENPKVVAKKDTNDKTTSNDVSEDTTDVSTANEETAESTKEVAKNTDSKSKTSTSGTSTKKSTSKSTGTGTTGSKSSGSGSSKSTHKHNWKPHTATRWVPNIVTVTDYEMKKVLVENIYTFNYDGYVAHGEDELYKHANELQANGITVVTTKCDHVYETRKVAVGTHTEDHGHNETYVDYYYCSCGARKSA